MWRRCVEVGLRRRSVPERLCAGAVRGPERLCAEQARLARAAAGRRQMAV